MSTSHENTILSALSPRRTDANGAVLDALARSLAKTISYDPQLKDISDDALAEAVSSSEGALTYEQLIASVRSLSHRTRERAEELRQKQLEAAEEGVDYGFLLQCWRAYGRDGHLCAVRMLTISFLARWLQDKHYLIEEDEKDWCAREAVNQTEDLPLDEREKRCRDAYEETLVLLVMKKIERAMKKDPEKTATLISSWEKHYRDYYLLRFGKEPSMEIPEAKRQPATKSFAS